MPLCRVVLVHKDGVCTCVSGAITRKLGVAVLASFSLSLTNKTHKGYFPGVLMCRTLVQDLDPRNYRNRNDSFSESIESHFVPPGFGRFNEVASLTMNVSIGGFRTLSLSPAFRLMWLSG